MRKFLVFLLGILIISAIGHFSLPKAYAAISFTLSPNPLCIDKGKYTLSFNGPDNTFVLKENYTLMVWQPGMDPDDFNKAINLFWRKPISITTYISNDIDIRGNQAKLGLWHYKLWFGQANTINKIDPNRLLSSGEYIMHPKEACELGLPILEMSSPVQINSTVPIKVKNINPNSDYLLWFIDGQVFVDGRFPANTIINETIKDEAGKEKNIKTASFSIKLENKPGIKILCLKHGSKNLFGFGKDNCEISIPIEVTIEPPQITPTIVQSSQPGAPLQDSTFVPNPKPIVPLPPCSQWANLSGTPIPIQNVGDGKDAKCIAVDTAIGKISTEPAGFVRKIFGLVLGLAGGIALILIIISGYQIMASQGNPEALAAGRGRLVGAIVGLLFIIFSFVILQIIGVDILKIPGFGQ